MILFSLFDQNDLMKHSLIQEKSWGIQTILFKYRIAFLSFSALIVLFFSIYTGSTAIYPCFILFGCLGCFLSIFQGRFAVRLFTLIYSIASIFAVIFFFIFKLQYGLPYQGGGSDGLAYEIHAEKIKNTVFSYDAEEIGLIINKPYHNSKGYIYFIALLMRFSDFFGGFHTMIARLFNVNILALSSVFIYTIAKKISLSKKQAIDCALVTGMFPIMIYTAVQTYRDTLILFIILFSLFLALTFILTKSIIKQLFFIACFYPLILFLLEIRFLNVINIIGILLVSLLIKIFSIERFSNFNILFCVVVLIIFSIPVFYSDFAVFVELVNKLDSSASDLAEGIDRAGEGGLSLILFNLPTPLNYFGSLFYSFITPLPILYTTDFDWNFLSIGTIYQFLFIPYIFLGIKYSYRSAFMLPLFFAFLVSFVGYVFGSFTFRHITYIVPFAAIYGTIGYEKFKKYRKIIWQALSILLFFLMLTYYMIKL